jgi:hypothetical protein
MAAAEEALAIGARRSDLLHIPAATDTRAIRKKLKLAQRGVGCALRYPGSDAARLGAPRQIFGFDRKAGDQLKPVLFLCG